MHCLELASKRYYELWAYYSNLLIIPQNYKECKSLSYIYPNHDHIPDDVSKTVTSRSRNERIKMLLNNGIHVPTCLRFEFENFGRDMKGIALRKRQRFGLRKGELKIRYFWTQNEAPQTQAYGVSNDTLYQVSIENKNNTLTKIGIFGSPLSIAKIVGAYFDSNCKRLFVGHEGGGGHCVKEEYTQCKISVFEVVAEFKLEKDKIFDKF